MNITFRMLVEVALAVLLLGSLAGIFFAVRRLLRRPGLETGGLFTVIAASGSAEELEQTVMSLVWLCENGKIKTRIVIADCGLTAQSRKLAELLAKDGVMLCQPGEFTRLLEENGWST